MHELLRELKLQSGVYKSWVERAADPTAELNEVEMCVYRTQAAEMEAVKPILIWLHEPDAGLHLGTRLLAWSPRLRAG